MKAFLIAVLLLLSCLAALTLLPSEIPQASTFGLLASLGGVLVVAVSVMALSRGKSPRG